MHDFLALNRCFVVRCSVNLRSSRRRSRIVRSTRALNLPSIQSRLNNRIFSEFIVSTSGESFRSGRVLSSRGTHTSDYAWHVDVPPTKAEEANPKSDRFPGTWLGWGGNFI